MISGSVFGLLGVLLMWTGPGISGGLQGLPAGSLLLLGPFLLARGYRRSEALIFTARDSTLSLGHRRVLVDAAVEFAIVGEAEDDPEPRGPRYRLLARERTGAVTQLVDSTTPEVVLRAAARLEEAVGVEVMVEVGIPRSGQTPVDSGRHSLGAFIHSAGTWEPSTLEPGCYPTSVRGASLARLLVVTLVFCVGFWALFLVKTTGPLTALSIGLAVLTCALIAMPMLLIWRDGIHVGPGVVATRKLVGFTHTCLGPAESGQFRLVAASPLAGHLVLIHTSADGASQFSSVPVVVSALVPRTH